MAEEHSAGNDNILSRSRSEDTAATVGSSVTTTTSNSKQQPWPTVTPVKVVTRLRPLLSEGENKKEAIFVDWSSLSNIKEGEGLPSAPQQQQKQTTPVKSKPEVWRTPPRHHHSEDPTARNHLGEDGDPATTQESKSSTTNGVTGLQPPSPSKIPTLSRNRWNQPSSNKPIPKSLIVESSSPGQGSSSSLPDPSQMHPARHFAFDAVLPQDMSQNKVYQHTVGNAVRRNLFRGYNTTICAYGQVGAGKSYTMYGPPPSSIGEASVENVGDVSSSSQPLPTIREDDGIIPRAIKDVFDAIPEYSDYEVALKLSFVEIHRDELKDLFADRSSPLSLQLYDYHHEHGHVVVQGLRTVPVHSLAEALRLIRMAQLRRTVSPSLNHVSSRSHAICTLHVTMTPRPTTATTGGSPSSRVMADTNSTRRSNLLSTKKHRGLTAKLTMVDLAGSERLAHTPTKKYRSSSSKSEAITINKDLFVLGKVVAALASPSAVHIPYRDSKLTRILRDSLGGNCCTVLIACISVTDVNVDESLHTLRYASRARAITQAVRKNVLQSPLSAHDASDLRAENQRLKARLDQYEGRVQMKEFSSLQTKLFKAEQEAQRAREQAKSVRRTADKWKEQFEKIKVARKRMHLLRSSISSHAEEEDGAIVEVDSKTSTTLLPLTAVVDKDLDELLADEMPITRTVTEDSWEEEQVDSTDVAEDVKALQGESGHEEKEGIAASIDEMAAEKLKLAEQLAKMKQNLADQQAKLLELNERHILHQQGTTAHSLEEEDEQCSHLDEERVVLSRTSDTKEDNTLTSIFRVNDASLIKPGNNTELLARTISEDMEGDDIINNESTEFKKLLTAKDLECRDLQENVDRLTEDNFQLHEENEKLRVELQRLKESFARRRNFSADVSLDSASRTNGTVGTADNEMFISNLNEMMKGGVCINEISPLATNSKQMEFYLPNLRVFCPCGKCKHSTIDSSADVDPTALSTILRPWQVAFLSTCGISKVEHLLDRSKNRSSDLAKKMRNWRRKQNMTRFRTPSCGVALHIWSRTCVRILKAVNEQKISGAEKPSLPDFMEIKLDPDLYTVVSDLQSNITRG